MKAMTIKTLTQFVVFFIPFNVCVFNVVAVETEFSALFELEWAYGTTQNSSQKFEFMFIPEMELTLQNNHKLTMNIRFREDIEDNIETNESVQTIELRDFYYEMELGKTYLKLGKQQVVWGKADGLKVLDIVNPQDFGEFILDDFENSRIPLWIINAEIPINETLLQLLWIPDKTYHTLPTSDSLYAFTATSIVPTVSDGISVNSRPINKPKRFFADSDYGLRLTRFMAGWDLSLNYLYHYHDNPVLFRFISLTPRAEVTIAPSYERSHLMGGTFSNAFRDFVLRGEIANSSKRSFISNNINDHDGVINSGEFSYVLGLDWSGIDDTFVSMQLFQSHVLNEQSGLVRDKVETTLTALLRHNRMNDTLIAEVLWLHAINNKDGLVRPKISYAWSDNLKIWLSANIFYGDRHGLFGQFEQNDHVLLGMQWSL
jgi:hypothetical protein